MKNCYKTVTQLMEVFNQFDLYAKLFDHNTVHNTKQRVTYYDSLFGCSFG